MLDSISVYLERYQPPDTVDVGVWFLIGFSMMADISLTVIGLNNGLVELNPIVIFGLNTFGYVVLAFLKVPAIFIGVVGWVILPPTQRRLNLIGLAIPWLMAVTINSWLLLRTLTS